MKEPSSETPASRWRRANWLALAAIGLVAFGGIVFAIDRSAFEFYAIGGRIEQAWMILQTMPPIVFFGAMALLCIFPIPISPFYVAAGPIYGFATAIFWIMPAIAVNQLLAHQLTNGLLRPWLGRLLAKRGYRIPAPRSLREQSLLTALIRVTPGFPYALQNWFLGLAGIEPIRYLVISWPIQMLYAAAWVLLGQSAFEGSFGVATFAVGLIVALGIVARWVGGRLRASDGNGPPGNPANPSGSDVERR
jgi:uncharacterized membrane protein YdjX (TVP38/TMEM64 family)